MNKLSVNYDETKNLIQKLKSSKTTLEKQLDDINYAIDKINSLGSCYHNNSDALYELNHTKWDIENDLDKLCRFIFSLENFLQKVEYTDELLASKFEKINENSSYKDATSGNLNLNSIEGPMFYDPLERFMYAQKNGKDINAEDFMDWYSNELWNGSPYSKHDFLGKGSEIFGIGKQIKYRVNGSGLDLLYNKDLRKSYVHVLGKNNQEFATEFLSGRCGQIGEKYNLNKVKNYMKSGKALKAEQALMSETFMPSVAAKAGVKGSFKGLGAVSTLGTAGIEIYNDVKAGKEVSQIVADVGTEVAIGAGSAAVSAAVGALAAAEAGALLGSVVPGVGNIVGAVVGFGVGVIIDVGMNKKAFGSDKTIKENIKDGAGTVTKGIGGALKDIY